MNVETQNVIVPRWIGVDLDGTLADRYWDHFDQEFDLTKIGAPILPMVERVKAWLIHGIEVRIFTARVGPVMPGLPEWSGERCIPFIEAWCEEHIGRKLPVTCVKDFGCIAIWDDIAHGVTPNNGTPCCQRFGEEEAIARLALALTQMPHRDEDGDPHNAAQNARGVLSCFGAVFTDRQAQEAVDLCLEFDRDNVKLRAHLGSLTEL